MLEKERIAAITALLLHIKKDDGNFYQGRKNQNEWAFEHRKKAMGLRGVRESKSSRTTWR